MVSKQITIFFLIPLTLVTIASPLISFGFWGIHAGPRLLQQTLLSPTDNNTVDTSSNGSNVLNDTFQVLPDPTPPTILDGSLRVEKVIEGLESPTSMAFLDHDDIIILQKDNGRVRLVQSGILQPNPIFSTGVRNESERGLLGVAIGNTSDTKKTVFLYYTEADGAQTKNRIYKYEWDGTGNLTGGSLILDLPGEPGPNHNGGKMKIGPDEMLYAVIGGLNRNGMLQNHLDGPAPDDS